MEKLVWRNNGQEVPKLDSNGDFLKLKVPPKCDFWCTPSTKKMNGSFGAASMEGNFHMSVRVKGKYNEQYDQAGLMIYIGDSLWLKTGIELVNEIPHISAVITNKYSDWSVVPINTDKASFHKDVLNLRVERKDSEILIDYFLDSQSTSLDDEPWIMLRKVTGFFPAKLEDKVQAGLMAASPQSKKGFPVEFSSYSLTQL
ncbi:hypothetical protein DSO57_1032241 [Entomophthora muscae]|uniref:Uncharacterized protein n=2 Tax=Entomophthora muscae TaxID=34485 RepID=A0ACC2SD11_9FUNG|nr:hypothetical protein DSO57_1032405 [Entomophthora muscae]KAJ9087537.1 hypothetical protein DSO57_1032241 [Entomophthora muscae]